VNNTDVEAPIPAPKHLILFQDVQYGERDFTKYNQKSCSPYWTSWHNIPVRVAFSISIIIALAKLIVETLQPMLYAINVGLQYGKRSPDLMDFVKFRLTALLGASTSVFFIYNFLPIARISCE